MYTSSVRRLKERGGGGAKITAAANSATIKHPKSLTPQSEKPFSSHGCGDKENLKRQTGKENQRPASRARGATVQSQKPVMKAMPKMDKVSAVNGGGSGFNGVEGRPRRSTSSAPAPVQRGRSSSPSEFNRILLSSGKSRTSSVEKKRGNFKGLNEKVIEKSELGKLGAKHLIKSGEICDKKEIILISNSVKFKMDDSDEKRDLSRNARVGNFKDEKMGSSLENGVGFSENGVKSSSLGIRKEVDGGESSVRGSITESKSGGFCGISREKEVGEIKEAKMVKKSDGVSGILQTKDGIGLSAKVKYPSKLHEKLAFLEGKVKRISSDIKKTKEMLDMNNPDNSKAILSDIQEKISGIEKAMGSVVKDDDSKANVVASCEIDDGKFKALEKKQEKKVDEGKSLIKGLNTEELEARLFPHHKLLRNRTSLKSASGSSQSHEIEVVEADGELNVEEKSVSPVDENPIAIEFLASLNQEQFEDTIRVGSFGQEICDVQETDEAVTSTGNNRGSKIPNGRASFELTLLSDERLEDFDDQEDTSRTIIEEGAEDNSLYELNQIGRKTTTAGWFVSEGEAALLAHDDGSCSFYDIINSEVWMSISN